MKKEALLEDIARGIPLVGGFAHGVADPAEGASRGETGVMEGIGGLAGGLGGAMVGGTLGGRLSQPYSANPRLVENIILLLALLGAGVGTAVGTVPGRALVRRDVPSSEELAKMQKTLEELRQQRAAQSININMPAEAHAETGEAKT